LERKKFDRVSPLLALKGSKNTFWAISPVSSVAISLKKFGVSLGHIEFLLLLVHSGQVAGNVCFFENDLFDPGIGYYTLKISLEKCFSR
jgi:hypothetical protein